MKYLAVLTFTTTILSGCNYVPDIAKAAEDIATDTAICVEVDKEAFQRDTDLSISVEVKNKEPVSTTTIVPSQTPAK